MATEVGHYKVLEQIGTTSLGEVYRARDLRVGRTVAIKCLPPSLTDDPPRRQAVVNHAVAVKRLSHPSVASLFDVGESDGRLYLVFEHVPGQPLSALIDGHPLNPRRAIEFGIQLADAIADAHAEGLVHGAISADSIFVTPKDRVKLIDFGFARCLTAWIEPEDMPDHHPTSDDPADAEPGDAFPDGEESSPAAELDAGIDLVALGWILFEMLTGKKPATATCHESERSEDAPSPRAEPMTVASTWFPGIPSEVGPILARALAVDPANRYQTAATLAAELRGVAAILDIRTAANEAQFVQERSSTGRRAVWAAVLAALATIVVGAWLLRDAIAGRWLGWFGPPPAPIVVVLPFQVDDTVPQFVGDGIAEDVAMRLETIAGLKVVGRSTLRSHRGRDPESTARHAEAAVALFGELRVDGDVLNLALRMSDAVNGREIWRRQFTSSKAQLLAMEASIMEGVVRALKLRTDIGAEHDRTASRVVNPIAYELYFRGREADTRDDLVAAIRLYRQAVEIDRSLAESHAALAVALYRQMGQAAPSADRDTWLQLRRAAENAVAADPDLPVARLAADLARLPTTEESRPPSR